MMIRLQSGNYRPQDGGHSIKNLQGLILTHTEASSYY